MEQNNESPKAGRTGSKLMGVTLAILLVVAAFFSGVQIGKGGMATGSLEAGLFSIFGPSAKPSSEADLAEFWRVWNLMDEKFVATKATSTPDSLEKVRGAIAGLVESFGDPYTVYMPPTDAEKFNEDIAGNFSGVGMEVGLRNNLVTVIAPLPETPAEAAGMRTGDVIVKINGESTEKMTVDQAVALIRGEEGTEVALTIYREGQSEFMEKKIVRAVINIPTLDTEVSGDVFIIRLYSFNALAESKMQAAVDEYARGNYKKMVLDLRGNPGGFLESAVAIAGYFLPPGKVVVRENFGGGKEEEIYRSQGQRITNLNPDNFVVLIDGGSASASEILAGALSEHKAATTIGQTTFGKGSVQELVDLPGNSALKVTIARWLTPEGVSFSEGGLEPLVAVEIKNEDIEAGKDPQKEAALKWLSGDRSIAKKVGFGI
jgi:carboxyl-terminal processing protease